MHVVDSTKEVVAAAWTVRGTLLWVHALQADQHTPALLRVISIVRKCPDKRVHHARWAAQATSHAACTAHTQVYPEYMMCALSMHFHAMHFHAMHAPCGLRRRT